MMFAYIEWIHLIRSAPGVQCTVTVTRYGLNWEARATQRMFSMHMPAPHKACATRLSLLLYGSLRLEFLEL
jgi:hypothetical protein